MTILSDAEKSVTLIHKETDALKKKPHKQISYFNSLAHEIMM